MWLSNNQVDKIGERRRIIGSHISKRSRNACLFRDWAPISPTVVCPVILSHCGWARRTESTHLSLCEEGPLLQSLCQEICLPCLLLLSQLVGRGDQALEDLLQLNTSSVVISEKIKFVVSYQCMEEKGTQLFIIFF